MSYQNTLEQRSLTRENCADHADGTNTVKCFIEYECKQDSHFNG